MLCKFLCYRVIRHDERIAEYDLGELDGKSAVGITAMQCVNANGAADPKAFQEHIISFTEDAKKLPGNTLLVSHDGVSRMIKATKIEMEPNRFYEVKKHPNATLIKIVE